MLALATQEYCIKINSTPQYINTYLVTLPEIGTVVGKLYLSIKNESGSHVRKLISTDYGDWVGWQGIFVGKSAEEIVFTEEEIHFIKVTNKIQYRGYWNNLNSEETLYTAWKDTLEEILAELPNNYFFQGIQIDDKAPYDWCEHY